MRILHLGYEDPRQPGSGGGSVRTREINERLAGRHHITVLVAAYPGAQTRLENGVRWLPLGPRTGTKLDRLAYFAAVHLAARRVPHDLLVEDFGAPFSVALSPLATDRPVIASVQWLFAREMRSKYRMPFDIVESAGLRLYDHFIAVSDWLARELHQRRPGASITTLPNGVPPHAFTSPLLAPEHLLFLGRLDNEQKGGDLLLAAYARVVDELGSRVPPLLVAGDGPDRRMLESLTRQRGLSDRVTFVGRVDGAVKFDLLARAYAVLMPSRFETFGLVAVEAQAAGAPVVAFDVGPVAEVAGPGGACIVPAFDVPAFARAAATLVRESDQMQPRRWAGRAWARQYDWAEIARQQEACYVQTVGASGTAPRRPRAGLHLLP